jgi:hypothetical protein
MQAKRNSVSFAARLLVTVLLLPSCLCAAQALPQNGSEQQTPPSGVMIDPSAGPLNPSQAPSTAPLPDGPQPAANPAPAQKPSQPLAQPAPQAPLGTAAAEQIRTSGGGASRPAGNAIAPVKQRQYHSLVIKLGAAAAAAIAVGAVYGLSHATSSTPPHSTTAATR